MICSQRFKFLIFTLHIGKYSKLILCAYKTEILFYTVNTINFSRKKTASKSIGAVAIRRILSVQIE